MKAIRVDYDPESEKLTETENAAEEDWVEVCRRFDNDVHRVSNITDRGLFTGLYACFDQEDQRVFYLVAEDRSLEKMRRKNFLRNVGRP